MARKIYLIRHAEPAFPGGEKRCLGQKDDLPLSGRGLEQARLLGGAFAGVRLCAVYTSPLLRARQTAAPIAAGRPLLVLPELIELHGGEWDGMSFAQLRRRYPAQFGPGAKPACPPGGETDAQGLSRARAALERVRRSATGDAALVAHGGLNRILLCALLGRPMEEKRRLPQDYACVSVLRLEGDGYAVEHVGLPPEAFRTYAGI